MPGSFRRARLTKAARCALAANAVGLLLWLHPQGAAAQQPPPPDAQQAPPAVGLPDQPSLLQNPSSALGQPSAGSQSAAPGSPQSGAAGAEAYAGGGGTATGLLGTPVSSLFPGNVPVKPDVKSPVGDSPEAVERGMRYFNSFNCVGCHAPNGGGGMGPSLSNSAFIYGSEPANIYLTIYQGRPRGMPAWGAMLPDQIIWDLVAYVRSISKDKSQQWGTTVSSKMPQNEQVPAEYIATPSPWDHTEAFSNGQKPNTAK